MRNEFVEIFEEWAQNYDQSVLGHDPEYSEVFINYEQILQEVADRSIGHVLEFGSGTGNLTIKLLNNGLRVTGIEPSQAMRKLAIEKIGGRAQILDGDFFHYPRHQTFLTVSSTYAFHHLTDEEKARAIVSYRKLLPSGGKIVFADTMYESVASYKKAISDASEKGYDLLATDLQREYYTTIPVLSSFLETNGFDAAFEQCNDFVWIMEAIKR